MQPSLRQLEDGTEEIASAAATDAVMLSILCPEVSSGLRDSVVVSKLETQMDWPLHHRDTGLLPTLQCRFCIGGVRGLLSRNLFRSHDMIEL